MSREVHTMMGTRVLFLADGGSVLVTKDESEPIKFEVRRLGGAVVEVPLVSNDCLALIDDCLALIEFLAVAARHGSGKELIRLGRLTNDPSPTSLRRSCRSPTRKGSTTRRISSERG